jgi:hypothetical protein
MKLRIKIKENKGGCGGCGTCNMCSSATKGSSIPIKVHGQSVPSEHAPTGGCEDPADYKNAHNGEEARMHRTTLAHILGDVTALLDMIQDGDDLPEWLESKITLAGDYMSSAAKYISGNLARDQGQLEE